MNLQRNRGLKIHTQKQVLRISAPDIFQNHRCHSHAKAEFRAWMLVEFGVVQWCVHTNEHHEQCRYDIMMFYWLTSKSHAFPHSQPFALCTMPFGWQQIQEHEGLHDWELHCGPKTYKVHKAALVLNSPVLKCQITSTEWDQGQTDLEELTGCASPEVVEMFLNYCYYGTDSQRDSEKLELNASNTIPFLRFCEVLGVLDQDEYLVVKIQGAIRSTNIRDPETAVRVLSDIVNLGPWNAKGQGDQKRDKLLSQISGLEAPFSKLIASNLDSLSEESQKTLQHNCRLLRMVLSYAKSIRTVGHLISEHLDHPDSRCGDPKSCFSNFAPTILRSIHGFTAGDATMLLKMGLQFRQPEWREVALKVKAMNFATGPLSEILEELEVILGAGTDQENACNILCDLLDRGDLAVRSEDEVFDKIFEIQAMLPKDQMVKIWPCCRFAHVSPERYPQLLQLSESFEQAVKLSQYLNAGVMWRGFREVKGDAGLDQFLSSAGVAVSQCTLLRKRLSPRNSYDKEVHVCEYKAGDPQCHGVLRSLGSRFGAKAIYKTPVGNEVQISFSRLGRGQPSSILDPSQGVQICHDPGDGTCWFKIDLGPRKRLKPSHCRFHLQSSQCSRYSRFPEFEVKKDDTARSDWLGAELSPEWTAEELPDGWKLTVSLRPPNQSFRLFQVVFDRPTESAPKRQKLGALGRFVGKGKGCKGFPSGMAMQVKNLELFGTLQIDWDVSFLPGQRQWHRSNSIKQSCFRRTWATELPVSCTLCRS